MHFALGVDVHVGFTADAELRKVDARLDGETGARQNPAFLVGFQIVDMGAVAMNFLAQ